MTILYGSDQTCINKPPVTNIAERSNTTLVLVLVGVAVAYMPYTRDDVDMCCICATGK